jgi:hypothetical protein
MSAPDKQPPPTTEVGRTWGKFVVWYEPHDYSTMRQKTFRYVWGDKDDEEEMLTQAKEFASTAYFARIDRFVQEIIDFKEASDDDAARPFR